MKHKYFPLALMLLLLAIAIPQFSSAQELTNVKVSELTDVQVKQLLNEVTKMGMTMEEASQMARLRGASETQIKELMGRIVDLNLEKEKDTLEVTDQNKKEKLKSDLTKKKDIKIKDSTLLDKKIFGFDLFNSENLTFEPSVNIQVPREYIVGVGDEFVINIWGASEAVYQSKVDKNGAIQIAQIGPVYVNGLTFEATEKTIRKRLSVIYNGLAGSNPNTYALINLGNLRSIQVTLVGELITPGTYTLPATASLFNALYLSTNELIETICSVLGKKAHIWKINKDFMKGCAKVGGWLHLPLNPERLRKLTENYVSSNSKIKAALGVESMPVDAITGLVRTIESFKYNDLKANSVTE